MSKLQKSAKLLGEISESWAIKLILSWLAFVVLAIPAALALTAGVPAKPTLLVMVLAIFPVQYLAYVFVIRRFVTRRIVIDRPTVPSLVALADSVGIAEFDSETVEVVSLGVSESVGDASAATLIVYEGEESFLDADLNRARSRWEVSYALR